MAGQQENILTLHLGTFSGVGKAKSKDGTALQVRLGKDWEIVWDGSTLYWGTGGKRQAIRPLGAAPLFLLGIWEGDGSFRLFFSPLTSELPSREVFALRVGEGWLEVERWRKGPDPLPSERLASRFLRLDPTTENVPPLLEKAWKELVGEPVS